MLMCAGLKAPWALPSRYAIAVAISAGDCTLITRSRFLRPASYQASPLSGSRAIGSTDCVSNSRSSTKSAGLFAASSARIFSP